MHQPNLFSADTPHESGDDVPPGQRPGPPPGVARADGLSRSGSGLYVAAPSSTGLWLRRLELIVRIVVHLYMGLIVLALPWTRLWGENHFFLLYPPLAGFATSGIARGVVSGLGLLNIWVAISDGIHYREPNIPRP